MATMEEIIARKAAEEKAKETAGDTRAQADKVDQEAERMVENQILDPNSPEAIKQSLEKSAYVAEHQQDAINTNVTKMLEASNIIDHQGRTSLDTPPETGMQTSSGGAQVRMNDPRLAVNQWNQNLEPNSELAGKAKGVYRGIDIVQFYRGNGEVRKADANGFFYAKTDEDVEMLDHYVEVGAVEKHGGSSSSDSSSTSSRSPATGSPVSSNRPSGSGVLADAEASRVAEQAKADREAAAEQARKDAIVASEKKAADEAKAKKDEKK